MFWANQTSKLAGIAMLILVPVTVAAAVLSTVVEGDSFLLARGDAEKYLLDVNDKEVLYSLGIGLDVVADSVLLVAVGALLYLVFRDRSHVLALFVLGAFIIGASAFLTADAAQFTIVLLAADFASEGGAGAIPAGDPAILQSARAVGAFSVLSDLAGITALAFGLLSLGVLIAAAPEGSVNPPRWVGALGLFAGAGLALIWLVAVSEGLGLAVSGIGIVASMILFLYLGAWLIMRGEQGSEERAARPAMA